MIMEQLPIYSAARRDQLEDELAHRELMHRRDHGVEVFLRWHRASNVLSIMLTDERTNQSYNAVVPNDEGLEAFYHPYAFLAREGLLNE